MLALSRRKDEGIVIDGNITIRILDITDGKVRIGIEAPKHIAIQREELYLEIEASNEQALAPSLDKLRDLSQLMQKK
ncbi:MAG: carbon storage regulator CsrA [Cellulosilyticaceae bacterium]